MKDALQRLLTNDAIIETMCDLLGEKLEQEKNKAFKTIENFCYINPDFRNASTRMNLSDMLTEMTDTLELKAFYIGVDFTLELLGKRGLSEYLPEELKAQKPQ